MPVGDSVFWLAVTAVMPRRCIKKATALWRGRKKVYQRHGPGRSYQQMRFKGNSIPCVFFYIRAV